MTTLKIIGWVLIGLSLLIRYLISRGRFNRRGVGGLQHFKSFERAVFIRTIEWLFRWVAILIMIAGIVLVVITW